MLDLSKAKPTSVPGVKRLPGGEYVTRVDVTDPRTGRRSTRRRVTASLAEAVAAKEELLVQPAGVRASVRLTWSDYAAQWLEGRSARLAPSTAERYVFSLLHLGQCAEFKGCRLDSISAADVRRWRDNAIKPVLVKGSKPPRYKALAPATVNGHLRVLKEVLKTAAEDGVLEADPAAEVASLPEKRTAGRRGRALTADQLGSLLAAVARLSETWVWAGDRRRWAISPDIGRMIATAAWTGMRKGEICALMWEDIRDGEIHVGRSVWRGQAKGTKTDDPRIVVVVEPLAAVLEAQRAWLLEVRHEGTASGLVFPADAHGARCGAMRRGVKELNWYRAASALDAPLRKACAEAGVPEVSMHSFRRTFANLLRKGGVDETTRRSMAGWRSESAQAIYETSDRDERAAAGATIVAQVRVGKKK